MKGTGTRTGTSTWTRRVAVIDTRRLHLELLCRTIIGEDGLECVEQVLADEGPIPLDDVDLDAILICTHNPGLDLVRQLTRSRSSHPEATIVVLAGYVDVELVAAAVLAGADLILPTSTSLAVVLDALRGDLCASAHSVDQDELARRQAATVGMTRRQHEVLCHLASGRSPRQIAELLAIKLDTCRDHIRALHRVLGCSSTTEVVIVGAHIGLLPALGRPLR